MNPAIMTALVKKYIYEKWTCTKYARVDLIPVWGSLALCLVWLRQTNRDLPWHCIRRSPAAARRYIGDEECNFSTDVNRYTLLFMVWRSPTPTLSARSQILLPSHIFTACVSRCAYTTIILCCRWMIYLILTTAMKSSICNTSG